MEGRGIQRWVLLLALVLALGWTACGDSGGDGDRVVIDPVLENRCVDCHLDGAALQLLAVEKEVPADTGEG